jgi:gentisate 1,2-dioxygenase
VFEGTGQITLAGEIHQLTKGDLFVVPSWIPWSLRAEAATDETFDLFRFSDAPVVERLHFDRVQIDEEETR